MIESRPLRDFAGPFAELRGAGNAAMPLLMGVVNVTPDSFSDGGDFLDPEAAVAQGLRLIADGAHILDIGGESTRPGAGEISVTDELDRVLPVIKALRPAIKTPISIDTRKPEVAEAAIMAGANIWNDVSALTFSSRSIPMAVNLDMPVILMHAQGRPETMQQAPSYENVTGEVCAYLQARIGALRAGGYQRPDCDIILDPGIGFGKTLDHNLALLQNLDTLTALGHPVLLGASRKRFIAALDQQAAERHDSSAEKPLSDTAALQRQPDAKDRLGGSLAAALCGARAGVACLRVHDVAETRQLLTVASALVP